jgi:hypothetical protein
MSFLPKNAVWGVRRHAVRVGAPPHAEDKTATGGSTTTPSPTKKPHPTADVVVAPSGVMTAGGSLDMLAAVASVAAGAVPLPERAGAEDTSVPHHQGNPSKTTKRRRKRNRAGIRPAPAQQQEAWSRTSSGSNTRCCRDSAKPGR